MVGRAVRVAAGGSGRGGGAQREALVAEQFGGGDGLRVLDGRCGLGTRRLGRRLHGVELGQGGGQLGGRLAPGGGGQFGPLILGDGRGAGGPALGLDDHVVGDHDLSGVGGSRHGGRGAGVLGRELRFGLGGVLAAAARHAAQQFLLFGLGAGEQCLQTLDLEVLVFEGLPERVALAAGFAHATGIGGGGGAAAALALASRPPLAAQ